MTKLFGNSRQQEAAKKEAAEKEELFRQRIKAKEDLTDKLIQEHGPDRALMIASKELHLYDQKRLFDAGPNPDLVIDNTTTLLALVSAGKTELVAFLLKPGSHVVSGKDSKGANSFSVAIAKGDSKAITALIDAKAEVGDYGVDIFVVRCITPDTSTLTMYVGQNELTHRPAFALGYSDRTEAERLEAAMKDSLHQQRIFRYTCSVITLNQAIKGYHAGPGYDRNDSLLGDIETLKRILTRSLNANEVVSLAKNNGFRFLDESRAGYDMEGKDGLCGIMVLGLKQA